MKKKVSMKEAVGKRSGIGANLKKQEKSKKAGRGFDSKQVSRQAGVLNAGRKMKTRERKRGRRNHTEVFLKKFMPELMAIVNSSPIPQFALDHDHRILYWNKALEAISGIKAEDVIGTKQQWKAFYHKKRPTLADLLIEGDVKGISDWYGRKCSTSKYVAEAYEGTDYFPELGQKGMWLFFTAAFIKDAEGNVIGAVETLEDITDRKFAELKLRESEERFRQIAESTEEWIWEINSKGLYTYSNSVVKEILGYEPEEIVGEKHFYDFFPPDDRRVAKKAAFEYFTTKKAFKKYVNANVHKNGSIVLLETSGIPILNSKGELGGYRGADTDITERKRAEEALRESEERWQFALEGSGDGVWDWNAQTNRVYFSQQWKAMLGYEDHEISGSLDEWDTRIHPDDRENTYKELNKHLDGRTPFYMSEHRLRCKNGEYKWILDRGKIIMRTPDDKPLRIIGTHSDITGRKKAENALRESEERFRQLVENAGEVILVAQDDILKYANPMTTKVTSYSEEELYARPFLEFVHPEDRSLVAERYSQRISGAEPPSVYQFRLINKDGSIRWVEINGVRITWNKSPATLNFIQDITARKQTEDALRQSEEKYRNVLETMEEGLYENDLIGNYTFVNNAAARQLGYTYDELIGMNYRKIFSSDMSRHLYEVLQRIYETGTPEFLMDYEVIRKDGTVRTHQANIQLIRDPSGKPIGFRSLVRDVTALKKAEEAQRDSESKYRELVENANSIILRMDTHGAVTFFNEFAQSFFGYTSDEIMGKNVIGTIVPETDSSGKDLGELIRDITKNPEKYENNENENIKKNGDRVWISWTNKIIQDKKGKLKEILCIGNDITGHKKSEDALRQSESKFRELADFLPEIVFELDAQGNVTYINRVALTLLGYSLDDQARGVSIFDLFLPADRDLARNDLKDILNGKISGGNEYLMFKKDQSTIPVIIHSRAIKPDGGIIGVRGIIVDISERKRAENALRESEEKFRRLFEDSGVAQLLLDGSKIIDCNNEAEKMMGCSDTSQISQKLFFDFSPEVQQDGESSKVKWEKYIRLAIQKRSVTFEWQYRRHDGELLMAEVVATAIPMSGKDILHIYVKDITERKRLQNEIINIIDVEQQRLGQNLHDGLGQDLTGVAFMCNTLTKKLKESDLPEAALSEEITSLVYHIITRVRMLSRELYPPNLVENEITYTLQQFAANISSIFGISCTFVQDHDLVISDIFISTQIYYIVREAVNNSIKHGQAKNIIISLTHNKNDAILVIEDNGIGRPESMDKYKGLGLRIMAYRMGTIHGTLNIFNNYKSQGVIIFCTFPIYTLHKDH